MKAVVLYKPGKAGNLVVEERTIPEPAGDDILIKIKAFGLNRSELMTRKGLSPSVKLPRVLGIECVGEVEKDPSGKLKKAQKVAALMGEMGRAFDGSYQEYAVLPRSIVHPFESDLDWPTLGALPEMFHTVSGSLDKALHLGQKDSLLIRGSTSSVGMLALQMAKHSGATVIATTRSDDKKNLLMQNGADYVIVDDGNIAPSVKNIFPAGVNKVLELVGANTLKDSLACCAPGGSVCFTGMLSEQWSVKDFAPMDYIPATVNLTVFDSGQVNMDSENFQAFINGIASG